MGIRFIVKMKGSKAQVALTWIPGPPTEYFVSSGLRLRLKSTFLFVLPLKGGDGTVIASITALHCLYFNKTKYNLKVLQLNDKIVLFFKGLFHFLKYTERNF